jgi:alanine racemase
VIRKAIAEIDLDNLTANYRRIGEIVNGKRIIPVIKADAYGHGAVEVARRLEKEGIYAFGVAYVSEAIELRHAGIKTDIIVFFDNDAINEYFTFDLIPVIFDEGSIDGFVSAARRHGRPINAHIKIDTGMGRVGLQADNCLERIIEIDRLKEITISGLMSHFSDADLIDRSFARSQLSTFRSIVNNVKKAGISVMAHIANSAGIMTYPDAHLDAVRPGLMLYGYSPVAGMNDLLPVMKVKTRLISLRKVPAGSPISYGRTFITKRQSTIGVIPVGYADGYNRLFSNKATVAINGTRAPVVGRVCMDLTMIDLTELERVREGDEVTILSSDHATGPTAKEMADLANTIPYEILTSLGSKAKRIYN